ncbi:MAG: CoA-binding protein [Desulfuromonas sp.]|nr:CoA-binding protein [Desulfuromonas sp.]
MDIQAKIDQFLTAKTFAVAGASTNRAKYGNKCLRCFQQNDLKVIPINPRAKEIEGLTCVNSVSELPAEATSLSVITPPKITEQIVQDALKAGITDIWMQPGAESPAAVSFCENNGINVIADGSCLLVVIHYHEH